MRWMVVALAVACGRSDKPPGPPPAAGPILEQIRGFADRACKCTDIACMHPVRDDFDAVKRDLLADGARLTGDDKTSYDAELMRLRQCGDGAGLTIWIE